MQRFAILTAMLIGFSFVVAANGDEEESKKGKHTTKEVMKLAHKDGLLKKVSAGDASDEEKKQLLDLYVSMAENEPKKGDAKSWKTLNDAVIVATAKVLVGRDGAVDELKKATNCKACHSVHK